MSSAAILFLTLFFLNVLLGVVALTLARGDRRSRSLKLWGWGLLIYAVSQLFFIFQGVMPDGPRVVIGNGFIVLSSALTALALYQYTSVRPDRRLVAGAGALAMAVVAAGQVMDWGVIVSVAAPTVYAMLIYLGAMTLLFLHPPTPARNAARFLAIVVLLTIIMWGVRMAAVYYSLEGTQDRTRADLTFSLFAIAQILSVVASTMALIWIEVRMMQAELRRAAATDQLTGLLNRRATSARLADELARCKRHGLKLGMVLFDVDRFKSVNDQRGHLAGDEVLKHVARIMADGRRREDVLGRIGGEEFLMILPQHDAEATLAAAERLRVEVAAPAISGGAGTGVTVSGGVAVYPDDGETWDSLFAAADRRMYRAKAAGRDRVESCDG